MERFTSSQMARKASLTLRSMVRSLERKRFLASCCGQRWSRPARRSWRARLPTWRASRPSDVDAVVLEEAAVLGGEHGLDDMVRHLVDRHGFALDDAALADLVAAGDRGR